MDPKRNILAWSLVALGGAAATGCGAGRPPAELVDARAAYAHAQAGHAEQRAPAAFHEAKAALQRAEVAHSSSATVPDPRTLGYVAERKAQLADIDACASAEQERRSQAQQVTQRLSTQPRPPGQPGTLAAELHFDTGKSDLTPAAIAQLDDVFFTLRDKPDTGVLVQGHTDSTGSADFNESLSQERANVVKDFLVGRGISADRIVTKGFGETEPVASNDTCENRARNRRADVTLEITTLRETP